MVEFSKSVAIFRWLLSARSQNSQDFLPKCHWDFRVMFRNFFWPSQSQICKHYNDFFVSFRSSPLSWISAKNVKNLDILHPSTPHTCMHASHWKLRILQSSHFTLLTKLQIHFCFQKKQNKNILLCKIFPSSRIILSISIP